MRKHTPGPWGIERLHGEINVISCNERDGAAKDMGIVYVLARDVGGMIHGEQFDDRSEVEANARLMVAAPEMLGALQHIEEYWNRDSNEQAMTDALWHIIETAQAAIAKATA
ncbi:hypothetical protein ACSDGV_18540 [Pseudomonas aeruginosa]|uniref:hypothetical protein n=1 Tax=Pseudomonas aeruginosa TaxID=287 RepID=UPI00101B1B77|nr:hypothetical protein [Pseudomonas aeruginosa]ELP1386031.1 hypothetical protein [Pseudomonas aeruginosa]MBW6174781.1 hypothetical protein [Pseudomonas aeruginosa]MBW6215107.1 hypothetical protein [Pseudomonas aeruginosa]MDG4741502.1 hypothetical protein [Pseudomonas aeruginosa]MZY61190.1 hypothetical protein [Pseudomonas aeruginosa]